MQRQIVFLVAAVVVGSVCAQPQEQTPQTPPPAFAGPQMAIMRVQQEEMMSQMYLDTILKMQHSSYTSMAGRNFLQSYSQDQDGQIEGDASQSRLLAAYNLLQAINIRTKQIVFGASQIQQEFFSDRVMQLTVQSAGPQVPPQILQIVYLKQYTSMLKTMKFSYALQVINHFRMWLEDEIDANVDGSADNHAQELVEDKKFAFSVYYMYTMLDMQLAYLDFYIQSMMRALTAPPAGPAPAPAPGGEAPAAQTPEGGTGAAFLEEETSAEPSQFFGMMAQNPMMMQSYLAIYRLWKIMFEFQAAQSAFMSSNLEQQAAAKEDDDGQMLKYSEQMFVGFAYNLMNAANIEYMMALFGLYSFYAPMMQGAGGAI